MPYYVGGVCVFCGRSFPVFFSSLTDGVARLPSPQLFVDPGLGLVLRLAEFFYVV